VSGGINECVRAIKAECPVDVIVASGGGWGAVSDFVNFEFDYSPDMTIIGAALYSEYVNR